MIDATLIQKIEELATRAADIETIDGEKYSRTQRHFLPERTVTPIVLRTLTSLVNYLNADLDHTVGSIVHVENHDHVRVLGMLSETKTRDVYAEAKWDSKPFPFNEWLPPEGFIISMQSKISPTADFEQVLGFVSSVKDGPTRQLSDTGASQEVTAKAGVVLGANAKVPNPVTLAPWRTFPEIDPAESSFILRARGGDSDRPPTLALFDQSDAWKAETINRVVAYLQDALGDNYLVIG